MLNMIFGRSGSGKTEYVFSRINELVSQGKGNILLLTPEQFSLSAERRLLTELGTNRISGVENGSFSRISEAPFYPGGPYTSNLQVPAF